jgi:hypothetical protein
VKDDHRASNHRHIRLPDGGGLCYRDVEGLTAKEGLTMKQATAVAARFNLRSPAMCWAFLYVEVARKVIVSDVPATA